MTENEEKLKSTLMRVKGWKTCLNTQQDHIRSHHFMANRWENIETVAYFIILGSKMTLDRVCRHEIKRHLLLGRKTMTSNFPDKGLYSQRYGFSSSHVWIWEKAEHQRTDVLNCGSGEESWESLEQQGDQISESWRKSTLNIHWKDWLIKQKLQYFGYWMWRASLVEKKKKKPDAGKDWSQEEMGATEDEMVGWHHWLDQCEFEQTPGNSERQESLARYSSWGHKE